MTLQEIQYKAQAIMQKWRDEDSAPYVEFVEELASMDVPELPDGLEEAAIAYSKQVSDGHNYRDLRVGFIAGAEYQRKQDQQLIELAEDHAMLAGMNKMKEQMMERAVEGYVNYYEDSGGILMAEAQVGCPYHNGDKVKIIVIKEEK